MKLRTITREKVVIVGAYSTGKYLTALFSGYGYQCIHIEPCSNLIENYSLGTESFNPLFYKSIVYNGNLNDLILELTQFEIKCAIPGSEAGVELADKINNELGLRFRNSMESSLYKRDKFIMQEQLKINNLASIPQFCSNKLQDILQWIQHGIGYPVVVKPISSSDSDGLFFCDNVAQLREAYDRVLGKTNVYGYLFSPEKAIS